MPWRIDGISAQRVSAIGGVFSGFDVAAGPKIESYGKAAGTGVSMYPSINAAQIELLPRLQLNELSSKGAPYVAAYLLIPIKNAVRSGFVKNIGESI